MSSRMRARIRAAGSALLAVWMVGCAASTQTSTIPTVVSTATPTQVATLTPTQPPTSTPVVVPTLPALPGLPDEYPGPTPDGVYRVLGMGKISAVDISPDNKYLAIQTSLGFAIYSVASLERIWFTLHRNGDTERVNWSPDSTKIATSDIWHVDIWDAQSGQQLRIIEFLDIYPNLAPSPYFVSIFGGVAWAPDSTTLAIRSHEVLLWDTGTGASDRRLRVDDDLEDYGPWIDNLQWSADGSLLAGEVGDRGTIIWNVESGDIERSIPATVYSLSPDLSRLLTVKSDQNHEPQSYALYDTSTDAEIRSFGPDAAASADWKLVADSDEDEITIHSTDDGALLKTLRKSRPGVSRLSWSPDGTMLASRTDAGIGIWDIQSATEVVTNSRPAIIGGPPSQEIQSYGISWSLDSSVLFTRSWLEHIFSLWDPRTGERIRVIRGDLDLAFLPGQPQRFFQGYDGELAVWDVRTGQIAQSVSTTASFDTLYWSADGKQVASSYRDEFVIWDLDTATPLRVSDQSEISEFIPVEEIEGFDSISPDGSRTVKTDDTGITLSDSGSGQVIRKIPLAHFCEGPCLVLSWSPRGKHLAGTYDGTLFLWSAQTGELIRKIDGLSIDHRPAFSPDEEFLAYDIGGALLIWKLS